MKGRIIQGHSKTFHTETVVLDSADTEMLPTYFQTHTCIISFHLQSFIRAGTLQCSTGQTKKMKKMWCSCQNHLPQSQIRFCLCGSFHAPCKQWGIPHPFKGLLQFSKNMLSQTATSSEFCAAKKHHLSCSLLLSWAKEHVRLCHLWAGFSVSGKCT